jgi:Fe2+ transport system protein FeoA
MNERARQLAWLGPAALLLVLSLALVPTTDLLRLAGSPAAADGMIEVVDELPADALVLVGFDPDLGTYAEIRPTVRVLLDDLLERGARLALVSLTPEGRALAIGERTRLLAGGVAAERLVDLGFVPGAEAALVSLADAIGDGGGGLSGEPVALGLVVGGNDIGPRSWVEQLAPRVEGLELVAVAPSVLLPELRPYLESGQLRALLGTPRDGAAYRESVEPAAPSAIAGPAPLAVLVGLLVAIAVLGTAVVSRLGEALRSARGREAT